MFSFGSCVLCQSISVVCRDIEAGLGEEWAVKGTRGTAERPHWGHGFWRGSHGQAGTPRGQQDSIMPVAPVAPVTGVTPVAIEGTNSNDANGVVNSVTAPSTGWV